MSSTIFDACRKGDTERVREYIAHKGCVTEPDLHKMTMLHHAAFSGCLDVVNMLLGVEGVDVDVTDGSGWTALHYAADKGHVATCQKLVDEGANVNAKDEMKKTPLHMAVAAGSVEVAMLLLQNGANKNLKTVAGWTPLMYAEQQSNDPQLVTLLGGALKE